MIGHLPCFSNYLHDDFPLGNFYPTPSSVRRVKDLLSALVDSASPQDLKQNIGAHGIAPVRPDSREGKELINLCNSPYQIYRIDYGDNPFRIVFAFARAPGNLAYIYAIDVSHLTMSGRHR